jgi:nucleobase:cation symporter-1, NCS1 family
MATTDLNSEVVTTDKAFAVEQNGINLIPDAERTGKPGDLFWVWAGANLVLTFIISGYFINSMGLSPLQMWTVVILGSLFYLLVGYGGIPGARIGTATMIISRAAFGRSGNAVPTLLSWITVIGWEAVNLALGAFALFSLAEILGFPLGPVGKAVALLLLSVVTFGVAILGHATIIWMQRVSTWAMGLIMLGVVPQVWSAAPLDPNAVASSADWATLSIAFGLVAALPFSYANYPADYSRYLPRMTSGSAITFWTFLGAFLPSVGLTAVGYYASKAANLADPVGGFETILSSWYFTLFVLVVLMGTISNNFLNTYSSGMSLLALGLRVSRPAAILVDAVLASAAAAYAIFFYDFTATFIAFLSLMVIWLAPWTGVYVMDIFLRNSKYKGEDLLSETGGVYGNFGQPAIIAGLTGAIAAALCTATALFTSPFAASVLGGGDLSIVAGFTVSALVYWALAKAKIESSL